MPDVLVVPKSQVVALLIVILIAVSSVIISQGECMQFAIIGLGVFGRACAFELQKLGNDVLGIDIDAKEVDQVVASLSHAVIADATDKDTLVDLNLASFDGVLVSIGEDLEASLLCTLHLINLPVQNLWVKAKTDAHHAILERLGVTNIIHPEQDMGVRIAQSMNYPMIKQYLSIGHGLLLVRIDVPHDWQPQSVAFIKNTHPNTSLLLIQRNKQLIKNISDDLQIKCADHLIFSGYLTDLKNLTKHFTIKN